MKIIGDVCKMPDMTNEHEITSEKHKYLPWNYAKLNSFRAVCMIVSLTAQNTSLIFSVSK